MQVLTGTRYGGAAKRGLFGIAGLALLAGCAVPATKDASLRALGAQLDPLHERLLTIDTHLDTPALLERPGFDIMDRHTHDFDYSQVDLPRMVEGGLDGGFWVIYTRQGPLTPEGYMAARDGALLRAVAIQKMVAANPDYFAMATDADEAAPIVADGKKIVYQSMENSYPLGEDISLLKTFYDLGVRMVGPVHFANNQFADSSTDPVGQKWNGLSPLGRELVQEANRLGIILDASHAHDDVLDQLIDLSATPVILSHSGTKSLYDHPRNVPDALLKKLAASGGVIHMNALGTYLKRLENPEGRAEATRALFAEAAANPPQTADEYEAFLAKRRAIDAQFPPARAEFVDYMDQVLYVLKLIGPDHVGFGADWDGGGGVNDMMDVAALDSVTARLLEEGYSEEDLAKMWGGNVLRLLQAAQDHALSLSD